MKIFLLSIISYINKLKLIYIFFLINLLVGLISILYCNLLLGIGVDYADLNNNLKIKNLQFWYGPVTENLINNNELVMDQFGINFYASRSPLIPLYIYVVYKFISTNIYVIFILKNIFFTSLIILISKKYLKKTLK